MTSEQHETGGTGTGRRAVRLVRTAQGEYDVTNDRGGRIHIGSNGTEDFSPVELLLAAVAGCSAVDVDHITGRRAEPSTFEVVSEGMKTKDEGGARMSDLEVTFRVRFPAGEHGNRAREVLPRALAQSHDRLCTVSRTVELGTPVTMRAD